MNKKIIAAVLAGACAVSAMSITASANKAVTAAGEVKLAASAVVATPAIDVSVPSTVAVVINPYGVPVEVKGVTYGSEGVTSPLYTIVNKTTTSNIKVKATASVTVPTVADPTKEGANGATKGTKSAILVGTKAADAKKDNGKSMFVYVAGSKSSADVKAVAKEDVKGTGDEGAQTEDDLKAVNATKTVAKNVTTYTIDVSKLEALLDSSKVEEGKLMYDDSEQVVGKIVFTDMTVTKNGDGVADNTNTAGVGSLMVLKQAKAEDDATYFTYGQFQIGGKIYTDDNISWGAADKVTVNLVLKLEPTSDKYSGED